MIIVKGLAFAIIVGLLIGFILGIVIGVQIGASWAMKFYEDEQ